MVCQSSGASGFGVEGLEFTVFGVEGSGLSCFRTSGS